VARDYRHGHGHKKSFQRQSQSANRKGRAQASGRTVALVWAAGFFISGVFLVGFFVTQHFVSKGVKSEEVSEQSIFKTTAALKDEVAETIEAVSVKLQPEVPKPPVVEPASSVMLTPEVPIEISKGTEASVKQNYSFYEGLGQTEVVVDVEPISVQLKHPYYVQAGTFGSERVALQEQRRLARLGQTLEVSALHKKTRVYYRLRIGPFQDRLILNKRRNELRRLGLDTILIKAPKLAP